jgi:histidyl-tRNA synthetase
VEYETLLQKGLSDEYHYSQKETFRIIPKTPDSPGLVLRPEGTTSVMRHHLSTPKPRPPLKVFYLAPMFRREQPQRGRLRQFYQAGIENLSSPLPSILTDFEALKLSFEFLTRLSLAPHLTLSLNYLGSQNTRKEFSKSLMTYFSDKNIQGRLSSLSQNRLARGSPLRILDSSHSGDTEASKGAPILTDFLSKSEREEMSQLEILLKEAEIPFVKDDKLVRGLEYYNGMCFEWKDSQGLSVMGGGRYDCLGEMLAANEGKNVRGVGWGAGFERLSLLLDELNIKNKKKSTKTIGIIVILPKGLGSMSDSNEMEYTEKMPNVEESAKNKEKVAKAGKIMGYAERVLQKVESKGLECEFFTCLSRKQIGRSFSDAGKKGIQNVVIIGEEELELNCVQVKNLETRESRKLSFEEFENEKNALSL